MIPAAHTLSPEPAEAASQQAATVVLADVGRPMNAGREQVGVGRKHGVEAMPRAVVLQTSPGQWGGLGGPSG